MNIKSLFEENKNFEENLNNDCSPESSECHNYVRRHLETTAASQERLNVHSRAYTTGWIFRKVLRQISCHKCEADLTSNEEIIEKTNTNNYISLREYKNIKSKKLTYPSEHAVRYFGEINIVVNQYLDINPQRKNLIKY